MGGKSVKKCPECGNPSYDGAPVCGNCGFKFPKPKVTVPKEESIFEKQPKKEKKPSQSSSESTIDIIKDNKLIIGGILLITLIVIAAIVITAPNNNDAGSPLQSGGLLEYKEGEFSFKYPDSWQIVNLTDIDHEGAKFFKNENNTIIEYYNTTMDSTTLKQIAQDRISYAQDSGSFVELVETITVDGRNTSNIIFENSDGNYTRFVSLFSDGKLYVFKISGESMNSVTSDEINAVISSSDIA